MITKCLLLKLKLFLKSFNEKKKVLRTLGALFLFGLCYKLVSSITGKSTERFDEISAILRTSLCALKTTNIILLCTPVTPLRGTSGP